ncbi:hypothetical protein MYX06_03285 [Patescibacteria group bacterium AH-259-L05]|nr:hypothetical protein [Patescibacteria group bacterium AH-259-L05]
MSERVPEQVSDSDRFKSDLASKTEEYAEKNFPYGGEEARAAELLNELFDDCAEALLESDDVEKTMAIIKETLLDYTHGSGIEGIDLFPIGFRKRFYHDLAILVAKKAKEK